MADLTLPPTRTKSPHQVQDVEALHAHTTSDAAEEPDAQDDDLISSNAPKLPLPRLFLYFFYNFGPIRLGRPRCADCPDQRANRHQGKMDHACPIPTRLRRLPDPSRARSGRALHVLWVLERWKTWRRCRRRGLHLAWVRLDVGRELSVYFGWAREQVLRC